MALLESKVQDLAGLWDRDSFYVKKSMTSFELRRQITKLLSRIHMDGAQLILIILNMKVKRNR